MFWAIKLKFLTGRACGRGEIIGADVVVGLETDLKERFANLGELCDFKLNYRWFVCTQTLECNLNLLYVYLGHAKRFVTETFSIALITYFAVTG